MRRAMTVSFLFAIAIVIATSPFGTAVHADESVRYEVTVDLSWTKADHAVEFPSDAHWARLITVAHTSRYTLFADGMTASSGLALLATNGRVSVLEAELAEARRRNRVGEHTVSKGLPDGVARFSLELPLTGKYPLISMATMLAPSPDWFAGANGVSLRSDAGWHDEVTVPIWVWDAGADSGATFDSPNDDTQPRESIRLLTHPAFLQSDGLRPIGYATFRKLP